MYDPTDVHSGTITAIVTMDTTGGVAPAGRTLSGNNQYFQVFEGVVGEDITYTGTVIFENYVTTTGTIDYQLRIDREKPTCDIEYNIT
jgi:hypothetical protein